jgi:hypothetical protein
MSLETHFSRLLNELPGRCTFAKSHHGGSICGFDRVGVVSLRHACMLSTVTIALHCIAVDCIGIPFW